MGLRKIIIDWLTGSRYVKWLEARHMEQRQDYTLRLAEKDEQIKSLKVELAGLKLECDRMRLILMPLGSPAGAQYASRFHAQEKPKTVPEFAGPLDWRGEMELILQESEQDGIRSGRRVQEHQSSADDGAQA